ncbi:sodium:proton antiporter [Humibacter sp. BT305]|nr:sodium:proton antiporter [Humibacter sp. BT305]
MRPEIIAVTGLIVIVALAALAPKLRLATPLVVVIVGLGVSLIPGVPPITIPSEWVLAVVLPPLLYSSAINVPLVDFRKNIGSITVLSVVLVFASAFIIGLGLWAIVPEIGFPAAIALGAVISPTDAVAATSIGKRLGLPPRLIATLEGESLVNDASALVLLRSATVAISGGVAFGGVVVDFFTSAGIAVAIGLVVGFLAVFVRSRLRDSVLNTALSFTIPFVAYLPTEVLNASGVLAVVVAGLYTGHHGARRFTAVTRLSERLNWRTINFLLENGVFLLMGLALKEIVTTAVVRDHGAASLDATGAILFGVLAALALLGIRFGFVAPLLFVQRWWAGRRRAAGPPHEGPVGMRGSLVLTWAGMRGVVTVAAAQSLPENTPFRAQLILIAFTVAVVTLLGQGMTLPAVIRLSGVRGVDKAADEESFSTLVDELRKAGEETLRAESVQLPSGESVDPTVIDRVRTDAQLRSESVWENARESDEDASTPHRQYRELRLEVLKAERGALLDARSRGDYPSRVLARAQTMLDQEEARLYQAVGDDDE